MSKRLRVKPGESKRRIFPNEYTREDLIAELVVTGAENYRQAKQIHTLSQKVRELETLRR